MGPNGSGYALTDPTGRYRIIEGLETGNYTVSVTARGYLDKDVEDVPVIAGRETSDVDIFLRRSGAVSGKVTGPDGKPVKGAVVFALQTEGTGANYSSYALTAEDGSYMINSGLSTGTYNVTAGWYMLGFLEETQGYIPQTRPDVNVTAAKETKGVNFQLALSGVISGKVTTTAGTPLVDVMVMATSTEGEHFGFAYTTSGGNYRITNGLGTGNYTVMILRGFMPVLKEDVLVTAGQETPNVDFQVSIQPSGSISGRVTDKAGDPINDAEVSASGPAGYGSAKTDVNGYYAISEGLGTGNYTVSAGASGYNRSAPVMNVPVTVDQETKGVNFQLEKLPEVLSGRISGLVTGEANPIGQPTTLMVTATATPPTVYSGGASTIRVYVASDGTPITTATVTLVSDKGGSLSSVTDQGNGTYMATFTAPTVTVTTMYTITASASKTGYTAGSAQTQVTVQPTPTLAVSAMASPATVYSGGSSTVKVSVTSGGTSLSGATISLASDRGGAFTAVTDHANGTYAATFTAPDVTAQTACTITASASKTGYTGGSAQTLVTVQPLVLRIYVKATDGSPLAGATVSTTTQPSGQAALSGTTDADGLIVFTGLLKGSYSVNASKTGYESRTLALTVVAGQATTETITLPIRTKTATTISASVSKTPITDGDDITVTGSVSPAPGAVTVTLTYRKPDGTTVTRTVTTTAAGAYTDTYKPTPKGDWTVTASWAGSETHQGSTSAAASFTVKEKGCIVATATYGSELSPEVQYLRGFRDKLVLSTFAGSQFMNLFNAWYYSFSPPVAGFIAEQPLVKATMMVVLYPLMGVLHLSSATYSLFGFNAEVAVVMAGLVASSLIGVAYFSPPLTALLISSRRLRGALRKVRIRTLSIPWSISVLLILVGELTLSPSLTIIATGAFVLLTLGLSATIAALKVARRVRPDT